MNLAISGAKSPGSKICILRLLTLTTLIPRFPLLIRSSQAQNYAKLGRVDLAKSVDNSSLGSECVVVTPHNGRPCIISNNDGCVIARSNEAKALGIAMGAPWHLHKAAFAKQGVVVRSSNYTLYGDLSARVMTILRGFAPDVEVYSIDEAFLDLAGFDDRLHSHALDMRRTVLQWTGIPVSVGIAPTKTLAKAANRTAKKQKGGDGVCILMTGPEQKAALSALALTDLWGVAGRLATRLEKLSITTPLQLRDADPQLVRQHLGVLGERLVLELRGIPCQRLVLSQAANKSIVASRSFGRPVTEKFELEQAVSAFTERAAEKLRRQGLAASVLQVFVTTNPFKPQERQYAASRTVTLPVASADSTVLLRAARVALTSVWRDGYRYKKAGVMLLDLVPAAMVQGDLWTPADTPARQQLMEAVDVINRRYGRRSVSFAASGVKLGWMLRSEQRSSRFTTDWSELLQV